MKRFLFSAIACIALVAASAASACTDTFHMVASAASDFSRWVTVRVESVLSKFSADPLRMEDKPRTVLAAAKSFIENLNQRARPTVTPRWRMCPSA